MGGGAWGGWVTRGRQLCCLFAGGLGFCPSSRRRPEALLNSRMAGHPVTVRMVVAIPRPGSPAAGFPPPARRVIRGPRGPEPHHEPKRNARYCRAFPCRSAPCARTPTPGRPVGPRSRTRCAPTRGDAGMGLADPSCRSALCGSAPGARQTYGAIHRGVAVAHRVRSHRQAGMSEKKGTGQAQFTASFPSPL